LIRHNLAPTVAQKWHADGFSADYRHLTAARIKFAHAAGLRVGAWTVNRAASVKRLASIGVDVIESDKPDIALAAVS
jgi:glycerophosphoryl diester phosphodiesterase